MAHGLDVAIAVGVVLVPGVGAVVILLAVVLLSSFSDLGEVGGRVNTTAGLAFLLPTAR